MSTVVILDALIVHLGVIAIANH